MTLTPNFESAKTNFNINAWLYHTQHYPNQAKRQEIIDGLINGFDIRREGPFPNQTQRNLPTDDIGKLHITKWLIQGCNDGHFLGPFTTPPFQSYHTSPVGTVPKDITKRRTIHHLSAPRKGISVNSEITQESKTVTFIQFKQVVAWIQSLGKNAFIWKSDLENAYRQLALHPTAYPLLGIRWLNHYVFDTRGPFGLASMVAIFQDFADLLLYAVSQSMLHLFLINNSISLHHLLDDFFGGHNNSSMAQKQFDQFFHISNILGVKVSQRKSYPPTQQLTILGYHYDTTTQTVSIPIEKIHKIKQQLKLLVQKRKSKAQELLSIVGKLRWVSNIIVTGSAFVRRLEQAAHSVKELHYWVRLNSEIKKDIKWWLKVLNSQTLNQREFKFILANPTQSDIQIYSDGSTTKGIGGYCANNNVCYQILLSQIANLHKDADIQFIELLALVVTAKMWAQNWTNSSITFYCDNEPVVGMLKKKCATFKRWDLMQLIRILCELANKHSFYFWAVHIPDKQNQIADKLSRFQTVPTTQLMHYETLQTTQKHVQTILSLVYA